MPYSQQQVLTQLEAIFGSLSRIATGRGSGAQGSTISVVLDQPIGGVRSVQAECFTPCPPPTVLVIQTNTGKWYAIGSNIATPIRQEVVQNRRSAPAPQPESLETFLLFQQQDLTVNDANFVYPSGEVRLYVKINKRPLKYLATLSRPDEGYSDLLFHCIPVRSGLYIVQFSKFVSLENRPISEPLPLDTFLVRSGQVIQHFFFETLTSTRSVPIPYPSEWNPYIPYLVPTFSMRSIAPEDLPPIYAEVEFPPPPDELISFVFNRKIQGLYPNPNSYLLYMWRMLLRRTQYQLSGYSGSLTFNLTDADLAELDLSLNSPLNSIEFTTPSPYTIRDVRDTEPIAQVIHADAFKGGYRSQMRAGNKFTSLVALRGAPKQ